MCCYVKVLQRAEGWKNGKQCHSVTVRSKEESVLRAMAKCNLTLRLVSHPVQFSVPSFFFTTFPSFWNPPDFSLAFVSSPLWGSSFFYLGQPIGLFLPSSLSASSAPFFALDNFLPLSHPYPPSLLILS